MTVGQTSVALPGVGSYIALAIQQGSLSAIGWAIAAMFVVILLYDQLIFRPLVVWGDRFRLDQEQGGRVPESWALTMFNRSRLISALRLLFNAIIRWTSRRAPRPELLIVATSATARVGRRA